MTQSHYSLRWNNHQSHMLSAFDALLQAETLVDVTLVCSERSVRAHKVVLSACSPFFQRIFSENPCKHPVIVLKDFHGWEVQAIVDFMYKGEISVGQEQLPSLIKAAESLQVRGLAHQDLEKEAATAAAAAAAVSSTPTPTPTPSTPTPTTDYERSFLYGGRFPTPGTTIRTPSMSGPSSADRLASPFSPLAGSGCEPPLKLPHMPHLSFAETLLPTRPDCPTSPQLPRRKQARPRRRSGELCAPQDLSKSSSVTPSPSHHHQHQHHHHQQPQQQPQPAEEAENLCIKKPAGKSAPSPQPQVPQPAPSTPFRSSSSHDERRLKSEAPELAGSPELDLSMHHAKDFPLGLHHDPLDSHSPLPFPPMPPVSALAMTPPHTKFFGLDSPLGLFPPGLDGCRNPLLDLTDPRGPPDTPLFTKKKMGRPKGQHSAPRGGPPRSWTNAELTEALQHVWNKKMTTSQASRIFGIPYNSLLMYVRGKYGKSLKLEQLRKDCIAGPGGGAGGGPGGGGVAVDLFGNNNNNNNNQLKPEPREGGGEAVAPNTRPPSADELPPGALPYNPFTGGFYSDFGPGFPIPVSMIHLLPQSEKNRDVAGYHHHHHHHHHQQMHAQQQLEEDAKEMKEAMAKEQSMFRPPSIPRDERRELIQQNGQE